jgi:hypothetical protein
MCSIEYFHATDSGAKRASKGTAMRMRTSLVRTCWLAILIAFALVPAAFAAQKRTQFDHLTTGFELIGQHRDLPCEACHYNAVFKGTPKDCAACHGVGTTVRATAKPANHILSTQRCEACHTPIAWKPAATFDHTQARGNCSTCHNGTQAQGKGATHIVTDLECNQCHSTIGWAGVMFSHDGITSGCARCHDNVRATGMPKNHIPTGGTGATGAPCESCHSSTTFTTWHDVTGIAAIHAVVVGSMSCQSCHETAPYLGMTPSTATAAADSRPPAALDKNHPVTGDCGQCHDTSSFTAATALRPANHIPTNAPCVQCHTTPGQNSLFSVTGVHQGVTECLSCHGPSVATTFANIKITTTPTNHIPIGSLDCNGSGCHSTTNVNPGGFNIGTASLTAPTLNTAGHTTVAAAVASCQQCHQAAGYLGMLAGTSTTAGDSRPSTALDANHPPGGDCGSCHTTTPTFAGNVMNGAKPANHIPSNAPCAQCHTTAGNYALYSVTGTHQGVTGCLTCHGPTVATTFANVTIVSTPANHFPIGTLDCNGSGCHTTSNVNSGGFNVGTASINTPTLNTTGHATVATAVPSCQQCHEAAGYVGMLASTSTTAGDSRPTALDAIHPTTGDCGGCHTTTPTFAGNQTANAKPTNHIPTNAPCAQCHTTGANYAAYSVTGTHQGVTGCLTCHAPTVATTFANIKITTTPTNHIPIGTLDCNGSGCHTTSNVNAGGFNIGTASITAPTLNTAGHATVAAAVAGCQQCHQAAGYLGMIAGTATTAGDSRPLAALDAIHPTTGDCGDCHTTTPTFAKDVSTGTKPANHIPTNATCAQCHTTAGNFALYSVVGTHLGVTGCLTCHGPTVATTFANVTIVSTPTNHFPIGNLDCNGSGCHTTSNVNSGGFNVGTASITNPTLNTAGHSTIAAAVASCQTCHQAAGYMGMIAGTSTTAGDSRPSAALDAIHPAAGDCNGCHTTTPTFAGNQTGNAKPANHIPTNAPCAQCHTTPGNNALYSVTGTHQGVTGCLTCHGPTVATTFANIKITSTPTNHFPIGNLDCNGSGCHTTSNVNPGGFNVGTASITNPTLNTTGHATVAAAVASCQQCHEAAAYVGMLAGTSTTAGDSRPSAALDSAHPTAGDCNGCHTTTPVFASNQTGNAKPANHIPTNAACAQCHTTPGNYAAYSVTGTHQGVTSCLTCHGPTVATTFANIKITTQPTNHIPTGTLDCNGSGCHTTNNVNPGGFSLGTPSITTPTLNTAGHTTVAAATASCQTCHQAAGYVGMIAGTNTTAGDSRPSATLDPAHPSSGDCNGCHTTTPTFAGHVMGGSKPSNHIPTNAPCAQCHTTAGNYAAYVMGPTGHAGITNGCAICHADGLTFANMAPPTLVEPPTGPTGHIPFGTLACELCHSVAATTFVTFSGTIMTHTPVRAMTCISCHAYNATWMAGGGATIWRSPSANHGGGKDCGGCHSVPARYKRGISARAAATATRATNGAATNGSTGGTTATARVGAVTARTGAVPTTAGTAATVTPRLGAVPTAGAVTQPGPFDHRSVMGQNCVTCHSQASGTGKPTDHIATTDACATCHRTVAWLPVSRVDHTQVRGTCASCHNGTIARGKPSTHVPATAGCESCHTTNAWIPARFDHKSVAPHTCTTCHDSVHAIGLPRKHIPTTEQCDTCHGTLAWMPVKLDHTKLTTACATCHNNAGAVGMSAGHMSTKRDCATCHTYPDWSALSFKHVSAAYPGQHRAALSCTACHTTNTDQVPYLSPANAGTCAACHAKDFKPDAHPKTVKGIKYSASELANCSGACHIYSDSTQPTITRSLPGPYHRVSDATFKH